MSPKIFKCILALSFLTTNTVSLAAPSSSIPSQETWLDHATVLEKFWLSSNAEGKPTGRFPTWRCNDGYLLTPQHYICPGEIKPFGFAPLFDRTYIRMLSRQTFGYGALFNLTGNPEALRLHLAGVDFLLKHAIDPNGGFYTFLDSDNKGYPERLSRTTQDLAYALVGLAMNAYLTHNPESINAVINTQKYIYKTYFDKKKNILKWVLKDFENDKAAQEELVAQLDQLNAYLLLTWRLLPETQNKAWTKTIRQTINSINKRFVSKDGHTVYGCTDNETCFDEYKGRHRDYGHRSKTFWMEYLAACGLNDKALKSFAEKGMLETLKLARTEDQKNWYESINKNDASWWIYAELDEAALTLALQGKYPYPKQVFTWLDKMTDRKNGEVKFGLKQHFWRNAYHSTEHALVGYIISEALLAKNCNKDKLCLKEHQVTLHFKPDQNANKRTPYTPYLFSGDMQDNFVDSKNGTLTINFANIRIPDRVKK